MPYYIGREPAKLPLKAEDYGENSVSSDALADNIEVASINITEKITKNNVNLESKLTAVGLALGS
jgi:hypothetical protein